MILQIILLIIGFILLIKGADYFVEGASNIASIFKVPTIIIGLTIVAFGTSAPEAAVSIAAGITGSNAIVISNIIGSNIFNLLLILGSSALAGVLVVDKSIVKKDFPFLIGISILLTIILIATWKISRIVSLIFLILIIIFVVKSVSDAKKSENISEFSEPKYKLPTSIIIIILSLIGIILGANLIVDSAKYIALTLGMSETLVGLTIVSIGTSLPELVTSLTAVRKGETGIAIGNIVGSNIFNILFILGLSGIIHPIIVDSSMITDLMVMLGSTILCYIFILLDKKLDKKEGVILLLLFIAYMAFIILRN